MPHRSRPEEDPQPPSTEDLPSQGRRPAPAPVTEEFNRQEGR
jgi:hypothetical protein